MEGGAMIEAGAMFAALLAALRVIEKLVDKKMGNGGIKPVQIDLNQSDLSLNMGAMSETLSATGQTLERINEKIDDVRSRAVRIETLTDNINRVVIDAGSNVHKIKKEIESAERDRLAEERGAARERAKAGDP